MRRELPTRQRILDAALDLFGARGVDAVSLDEIAREVGVRKQTVLYWFPSKDELVDAVLETAAAELVVLIDAAVRRAHALTGAAPLLVCHSMGGLAARAWRAATPDADTRVRHIVTIGSPHHGTWLAQYSRVANGRQMRQDGPWLQALRQREAQRWPTGTYAPFICWYSNADNIVFPASTATLPGADNRFIHGHPHVAMAFVEEVMEGTLSLPALRGRLSP